MQKIQVSIQPIVHNEYKEVKLQKREVIVHEKFNQKILTIYDMKQFAPKI